jgi:hypothetical protein
MSEDTGATRKSRFNRVLANIVEHADDVGSGVAKERPAATHYLRTQLNKIREEMAKDDPMVADLFPPVPDDTLIADVALVAQQLLDLGGESLTERTARAFRHGRTVAGENVGVYLSDLADLGVQIREKVAEALEGALHPGDPKDDEELEARIKELGEQAKEAASRISKDAEQGYEDASTLAQLAKDLARLQLRKARKRVHAAVAKSSEGPGPEPESDEADAPCCEEKPEE